MSDQSKSRLYQLENLALCTHEPVLGVDICVDQLTTYTHDYTRDREDAVEVRAYGSDTYATAPYQRRYLAKWARRNLFGGTP